ncbi:MAG: hypothetical protein F6J86_26910 [Symploca sp. SIO1B1]|nr:hypothetical protein [Symploca sp. SIO1B1]
MTNNNIELTVKFNPVLLTSRASGVGKDWVGETLAEIDDRVVVCKFANPLRHVVYETLELPSNREGDRQWENIHRVNGKTVQEWLIWYGQRLNAHYLSNGLTPPFAQYGKLTATRLLSNGQIPIFTDCRQPHELEQLCPMFPHLIEIKGGGTNKGTVRPLDGIIADDAEAVLDNSDRRLTKELVREWWDNSILPQMVPIPSLPLQSESAQPKATAPLAANNSRRLWRKRLQPRLLDSAPPLAKATIGAEPLLCEFYDGLFEVALGVR